MRLAPLIMCLQSSFSLTYCLSILFPENKTAQVEQIKKKKVFMEWPQWCWPLCYCFYTFILLAINASLARRWFGILHVGTCKIHPFALSSRQASRWWWYRAVGELFEAYTMTSVDQIGENLEPAVLYPPKMFSESGFERNIWGGMQP